MVWSFMFLSLLVFFMKTSMEYFFIGVLSVVLLTKSYYMDGQFELNYFFMDQVGMNMAHLSLILTCLSVSCFYVLNDFHKIMMCYLSGMIAFVFFHSNNLMMFFILFEFSMVPLAVLILGWGKQPERIMASKYMILYTIISSFPLFCFMIYVEMNNGLFGMINDLVMSNYFKFMWLNQYSTVIFISYTFAFLMKVPLFFIHSWLPKAHVEAPLEGSIILAGIMLKVGMFGMVRMYMTFNWNYSLMGLVIFSVAILGSVFSMIMAISSDDLKLSIALSSVSHMNFLMSSIISGKELILPIANMVMISHGFSSSMLFFFVTIIYEMNNSRSLVVIKGSMSKFPSTLMIAMVFFSISISIPPSVSFLGEMMSISSIWSYSLNGILIVMMFIVVNSFFCMMSYGLMSQSPIGKFLNKSNMDMTFNLNGFLYIMMIMLWFFFPESLI